MWKCPSLPLSLRPKPGRLFTTSSRFIPRRLFDEKCIQNTLEAATPHPPCFPFLYPCSLSPSNLNSTKRSLGLTCRDSRTASSLRSAAPAVATTLPYYTLAGGHRHTGDPNVFCLHGHPAAGKETREARATRPSDTVPSTAVGSGFRPRSTFTRSSQCGAPCPCQQINNDNRRLAQQLLRQNTRWPSIQSASAGLMTAVSRRKKGGSGWWLSHQASSSRVEQPGEPEA